MQASTRDEMMVWLKAISDAVVSSPFIKLAVLCISRRLHDSLVDYKPLPLNLHSSVASTNHPLKNHC